MANLRNKYKPVKLEALKKKVQQEDALVGVNQGGSDFLEIKEGATNKFRLLPPHDGADYYIMRKRYWLTLEDEDGEEIRRTVLDSRAHGGTKRDIIQEYVNYCKKNVTDKDTLEALTHWKDGLNAQHHFIAYAVKIQKDGNEFGLLAFKKTVRDAINKATFVEDDDEPIEVDPFTDVDDGLPLLIRYNSKPNKKKGEDFYDVQVGKKAIAISDSDLDLFDQAKPLTEMYVGVYGLSQFETALEGLKFFDAKFEVDAFDDDSWLDTIETVKGQYDAIEDEDDEDEDEKPAPKKQSKKPAPVVEEEEEDEEEDEDEDSEEDGDEFSGMSRMELKKHIKSEELDIVVKKSMSDEDIADAIRNADSDEDEDEDEEDEQETSGSMSMDDIRARLKGK